MDWYLKYIEFLINCMDFCIDNYNNSSAVLLYRKAMSYIMDYDNFSNIPFEHAMSIQHNTKYFFMHGDLFFIFFIIIVLLFTIYYSRIKSINNFKKLIKIIIFGLFLEIFILFKSWGFIKTVFLRNDHFYCSEWVIFIKIFICIVAICVFISILDYFNYENFISFELPIIMLLSIEGMFLLVSANDLFILYLAIEIQSLALYILASVKRYSNLSIEAGLKYFILGSFASALLLLGISWIYGFLGTTCYSDIYIYLYIAFLTNTIPLGVIFGFLLILIGLFFKLGIAPFHYWIADVYEGSPTIITYFFSVLPKIAVLVAFYRVFLFVIILNLLCILMIFIIFFYVF